MKFEQNWLSGFRGEVLKMLTDGRTDGKVNTIAHPEHSSGELKIECHLLHLLSALRVNIMSKYIRTLEPPP